MPRGRLYAAVMSLFFGMVFIAVLHRGLGQSWLANILLDNDSKIFPFTIQNVMWLVFAIGFGELTIRIQSAWADLAQLNSALLPEDDETILQSEELGDFYRKANEIKDSDERFLSALIKRVILNFQTSRSISQANSLLNSSLELYIHELDLRYNMLRYIMWLIPSLGFLGTVVGISNALDKIGFEVLKGSAAGARTLQDPRLLIQVVAELGLAFHTTILALLMAVVLVFFVHVIQAREEKALNLAGNYCLDNLVNRLFER